MPSQPVLSLQSVTKSIDTGTHRVDILRGIDLDIHPGEFVAVMGASGSGKSTLLGLLAGLDSPTTGSIQLDGEEISRLGEDALSDLRGRKIGFVFQSYQLIPTLTAEENVLLPAELAGETGEQATGRARMLLSTVGLQERLDHYPVQLSGGEQQRVALARAFMRQPPLLLADEPTGNLDSVNGRQILDLLVALNSQEGATLVLVTHDRDLAALATRIITLRDGLVVSDDRKLPA
ncbi:MAG: ABC transporter ATP-binding protein [Candidatus Solibacter usitatus]|nr:ABC transporter ATP-binding protein [Candidatus Solibacter usitatus]